MDGFRTQFDYLVHHLYKLHGVDCTYTRNSTAWTVKLIPHIGDQYMQFNRMSGANALKVLFRSIVSSTESYLSGKTASETFVTPLLGDKITVNSESYTIVSGDDDLRKGWRYLNDRRNQIEICTAKMTKPDAH